MERAPRRKRDAITLGMLAGILLAWSPALFALDPSLDISQYAHTAWKIRDGFFKGSVSSIAQTPDGYLWLGTEFGLLRFDGIRTIPFQPPRDQQLPSSTISALLTARDGNLWIGTSEGLTSWKGGKLTQYPELAGQYIYPLREDREGSVWAGGLSTAGKLCAIRKDSIRCYGGDGSLGHGVFGLYEDSNGGLWAAVTDGLWRWQPGPPKFYPLPGAGDGIQSFSESDESGLLIGTRNGIRQFVSGRIEAYSLPGDAREVSAHRMLRDREGGLWIGTRNRGLVHVHHGRTDVFTQSDGLSSDHVAALFEDREGNIWVATSNGIDRFREFAVDTLSAAQGLSSTLVGSVLAGRDGSVWLGTNDGLNRWKNGEIIVYRNRRGPLPPPSTQSAAREINDDGLPDNIIESLFQDEGGRVWVSTLRGNAYFEDGRFVPVKDVPARVVQHIAEESAGNLWISDQDQGLFHLRDGSLVERIPWARFGRKDSASALVPDRAHGGLWLGFVQGGVAYIAAGQLRTSYAVDDGLGKGRVANLRLDRDGTLWAATEGGLSRLRNGRIATLTGNDGLPCDAVHWVMEDDAQSFWLGAACGLVRIPRSELDAWAAAVDQDKNAKRRIQATVFDNSDGVRITSSAGGYNPKVTKSTDGKLWFGTLDGVNFVDPRRLPFNRLPPPVTIEQITADRKTYDADLNTGGLLYLPPRIRDLEIDYTAYSFVAPEKVRFRYKLEGHDRDWQDVGNRRQAFYNDLPPRNYRFRVSASNNSGVWNEAGASVDFAVAPAYDQTTWFRLSVLAAFLLLLAALYRLRLRRVARHFEVRLEERTRIAQDLHDTLLQGCLSASMQLTLAVEHMPADLSIRNTLVHVQEVLARVVDEGRNAVRGLRVTDPGTFDLEQAFYGAHKEIAVGEQVVFRVIVEGRPRPLHPVIRDEVYRIGREAMANAFRHARARHIEVEIDYAPKGLRLSVRDDGCGIDSSILSSGREGHFGLSGMRERAERIGARIRVSSRNTAGTEVDIAVPGKVAFQVQPSPGRVRLAKLVGKAPDGGTR